MSCSCERSTSEAKCPVPARGSDATRRGSWALPVVLVGMLFSVPASAENWQSTLELSVWQRHATEGRLLELDSVRELLRRFQEREGVAVIVRHPGGDLGSAWAAHFRDRLVAYGIPSAHIELLPGSGALDILHVSLTDGR
jgi:hypothetical protein